jgi:DTW domain-containing protein YfiP
MVKATENPTSTSPTSQLTPNEMRGLAKRLRARAQSVLLRHQPEQHRDLLTGASLIEQLADLAAEVLSSAAVIDRLARLLRIAGGA